MAWNAIRRSWVFAAAVVLVPAVVAGPVPAKDDALYTALVEKVNPGLVTVKFVLKSRGPYGSYDAETEIIGTMIGPQGLVLCASARMGGGGWRGPSTPTDIKVLIGEDTEGLPAKVIARDTELGLAWLQIQDVGEKRVDFVDLTQSTTVGLGQPLYAVGRMGRFFDRAPLVTQGLLAGRTLKPRKLLVAGGAIEMQVGLPVYAANGQVVGVPVAQQPEDEDVEHSGGRSYAMMGSMGSGLILPAEKVVQATQRAKEVAQADQEEEQEAEEDGD